MDTMMPFWCIITAWAWDNNAVINVQWMVFVPVVGPVVDGGHDAFLVHHYRLGMG